MKAALVALVALCLIAPAGPAFAQVRPAAVPAVPVPIALPQAPPAVNGTSRAIFDALLAISRAQQVNPQAAQTAAFDYARAVQQYRSGNYSEARRSAAQAESTAATSQFALPAPAPTAALVSAPAQLPGLEGGLYGGDAPAIDADSFLALARGLLDECASRRDPHLATARERYARAARAFAARDWQATRVEAKAAIDLCAKPR